MARLLLDEQLPRRLKVALADHAVSTVQDMRWAGLKNGALLRRAQDEFDVFVTMDKSIPFQQAVAGLSIGVLLLRARSNSFQSLRSHVSLISRMANEVRPGHVTNVDTWRGFLRLDFSFGFGRSWRPLADNTPADRSNGHWPAAFHQSLEFAPLIAGERLVDRRKLRSQVRWRPGGSVR